jgi:hypothetical protein
MICIKTVDNIETKVSLKPEDVMITAMEDFDNVRGGEDREKMNEIFTKGKSINDIIFGTC